jgi:hypothetical protein
VTQGVGPEFKPQYPPPRTEDKEEILDKGYKPSVIKLVSTSDLMDSVMAIVNIVYLKLVESRSELFSPP